MCTRWSYYSHRCKLLCRYISKKAPINDSRTTSHDSKCSILLLRYVLWNLTGYGIDHNENPHVCFTAASWGMNIESASRMGRSSGSSESGSQRMIVGTPGFETSAWCINLTNNTIGNRVAAGITSTNFAVDLSICRGTPGPWCLV